GLSVLDYLKIISVQQSTASGLQGLAPTITRLADAEGLRAHGDSVRIRVAKAPKRRRGAVLPKTRGADA
ncbi:MAG: histidinol dehydrogenase, partial [Terriglobales bacterium]